MKYLGLQQSVARLMLCLIFCTLGGLVACEKSFIDSFFIQEKLPPFVEHKGDRYIITLNEVAMELTPKVGGRIASLKYAGQELLLTPEASDNIFWGNVVWTTPQADWHWPPLPEIDSEPYELKVLPDGLMLSSQPDKVLNLQLVKYFKIDKTKNAIVIDYSVFNRSTATRRMGIQEVTRVLPRGYSFFEKGYTEPSSGIFNPLALDVIDNIVWFKYAPEKIEKDHHKMTMDAKGGWLAHVDGDVLLLKTFQDVPVDALTADEGEVEFFAHGHKTYTEVKHQSGLQTLKPGEHLDWRVTWYLRELPQDMSLLASRDLLNLVDELKEK